MSAKPRGNPANAYTPSPQRGTPAGSSSLIPMGAGVVAAAAGLAWLLAPGFSAPKAPEAASAPAAAPAVESAPPAPKPAIAASRSADPNRAKANVAAIQARSSAAQTEALRAYAESAPAANSVAPAGLVAAALALTSPQVEWSWPRQLKTPSLSQGMSGGSGPPDAAAPITIVSQTILAWNPNGPLGQRALYNQVLSDGTERERNENGLAPPLPNPVWQEPLFFDLTGKGIKTSSRKVIYGITGTKDGDKLKWLNDAEEGMGILVFDADKDGASGRTGLELFGDQTDLNGDGKSDGFPDGFSSLHAFVDRASADGVLPKDARAGGRLDKAALAALEKAYGLKMKVGGFNRKPVSLEAAGVVEIGLSEAPADAAREFDGRGNGMSLQQGAAFLRRDGSRGIYADVWLTAK